MKRLKLGVIQRCVLEFLEEMADVSVALLISGMNSKAAYRNLREFESKRLEKQIKRSLKLLENENLVEVRVKSGEPYIRLSRRKEYLRKYKFDTLKLQRATLWDGMWRVAIFDIPERYGRARRALSYKLQQIGALRLQDSVFIYPFPWREELEFVAELFLVGPYVRFLEVASIDGSEKLRKYFHL